MIVLIAISVSIPYHLSKTFCNFSWNCKLFIGVEAFSYPILLLLSLDIVFTNLNDSSTGLPYNISKSLILDWSNPSIRPVKGLISSCIAADLLKVNNASVNLGFPSIEFPVPPKVFNLRLTGLLTLSLCI